MSEIVSSETIERIVGAERHATEHIGRAVSRREQVYVMHSRACLDLIETMTSDLRACPFSVALDEGIGAEWAGLEDLPVRLAIGERGRLLPVEVVGGAS